MHQSDDNVQTVTDKREFVLRNQILSVFLLF